MNLLKNTADIDKAKNEELIDYISGEGQIEGGQRGYALRVLVKRLATPGSGPTQEQVKLALDVVSNPNLQISPTITMEAANLIANCLRTQGWTGQSTPSGVVAATWTRPDSSEPLPGSWDASRPITDYDIIHVTKIRAWEIVRKYMEENNRPLPACELPRLLYLKQYERESSDTIPANLGECIAGITAAVQHGLIRFCGIDIGSGRTAVGLVP